MSDIKNPDHKAENPAPMPRGHKAKMAPHPDAPPGLEQDGRGNVIRWRSAQKKTGKKP